MKKVFLDLVPISSNKPLRQQRLEARKGDQIQKWSGVAIELCMPLILSFKQ